MRKLALVFIAAFLCNVGFTSAQQWHTASASPHVIVYKTKKNYRNNVPVILSEDRSQIISYPGPGDIVTGSGYTLPVILLKGYLLDKRGIGKKSAFLSYTYEKYSKLTDLPPLDEMNKMIIDRNPIAELYDCGVRNPEVNSEEKINQLIDKKQLKKKCKEIR